jgi:hypothetical protein
MLLCLRCDFLLGIRRSLAAIGVFKVDVPPRSSQNRHPEVVQPWRRECRPSRGPLDTCWNGSGKARTSPRTAADGTASHRLSWRSSLPQNSRHLRISGDSSTNTRSQPNSIPSGQSSLWPLLFTKDEPFFYSRTLAVSRWTEFLNGTRNNRSTCVTSCKSRLV